MDKSRRCKVVVDMKSDFGNRLRSLRKERSLTQAQLADFLKKSPSAVRMWELGSNEPDMTSLIRMSNLFGCSLDYLLCREKTAPADLPGSMNAPVFAITDFDTGVPAPRYKALPSRYCSDGKSYLYIITDSDDMHPLLHAGDTVLVRKQDSCMNGQIAFVSCAGVCMFRKLLYQNGGIVLQPLHSDYGAVFVPMEQVGTQNALLYGIAVQITREI